MQRDASDAAFSVFTVDAGATATISGLTISGGSATNGGGIDNLGSLTVSDSALSGNTAGHGGGIHNDSAGSLTVSNSTVSGNSADEGGGIDNPGGTVTVSGSTLSGNTARDGGGIENQGSVTVTGSTLSGNVATTYDGGGIREEGFGPLTVSDSTLSGNSAAGAGGGIFIDVNGTATVTDSTLSGNSAGGAGAIFNAGIMTVSGSTLYGNSATSAGGIGIWPASSAVNNTLHNTLIAGNLAGGNPSDVSGSLNTASDYNLIGDGSGGLSTANHNLLGSSTNLLDPLLAPLSNYGGPTQTLAVLPGSPAIDAGSSAYGGSTDQRGKPRVGATDIGAFESQGFTLAISSGNNQTTFVNAGFDPLVVNVTANNAVEPVAGGVITFTAPASGASAVLGSNPATIGSNGQASVTATANGTAGNYTVSASATGVASPASFSLSNAPSSSTVTIDFDNLPGTSFIAGTQVPSWALLTDQYAGLGVIFQRTVVCDAGVGHAVTGSNFIAGITPTGTVTYSSHYPQIEFSFFDGQTPATTDFVSIRGDLVGGNGQSQTLYAYDLAGNLVGSSTEMDTGGQTYSISAPGIHTIKWSGVDIDDQPPVSQGGGVGLDHLVFDRVVPAGVVVTTLSDENDPNDGTTSLREAIAYTETQTGPQTIVFDPSILTKSSGNVIDLLSALPDLTGNITIQGPGANVLTVQRDASASAFSVFTVDAGATATISGLTISGGSASDGGGIDNLGNLTVSNSTLSGNSATDGGGISNDGTLSVDDSTLSGNAAANNGGGIANNGSLTVSDSTLSSNTASDGGGIYNNSSESATLSNATLADNSASTVGGGIDVVSGDVLLHNTLIAGDLVGDNPSDISGSLDSNGDYNLIGDGSGGLGTANHNLLGINPLLAPLGNYGGPTQTMAVLPGSLAIDAGSSAYGGSTDERGMGRVGATDIGAFESQGFTLTVSSGNNQSTMVASAFDQPLVVSVTANNAVEPVAGGIITFVAPTSGASATITGSPAVVGSNGQASVTAIANAVIGSYMVSASASGVANPAHFSLDNTPITVTTLSDENDPNDGTTSLREAIAYAETLSGPQTITFDPSILTKSSGDIIDLLSALPDLTGNVTIQGPGANLLTVQRDASDAAFSVFTVDAGATAVISGLTISGGSAINGGGIYNAGTLTVSDSTLSGNNASGGADAIDDGGGIYNAGYLTVSDSILSDNTASFVGGGIYNRGSLTVSDSRLSDNSANSDTDGGGIYNDGSLTVSDSTLSGNSAAVGGGICNRGSLTVSDSTLSDNSAADGGGIFSDGSLTVSDSTVSDNSAGSDGGGIDNGGSLTVSDSTVSDNSAADGFGYGGGIINSGILTVSDSTLSGNTADYGGGIYNHYFLSSATLSNATLADNRANSAGGGIDADSGSVLLHDTLISGNLIGSNPSDISGNLDSGSDYNLISDGSGGLSTANHNLLGSSTNLLDPLLAPLGNYGGPTQTMALLPGSPAIDAGSSAYGGSTDQRGEGRVGATDIGAFESQGFTIAMSSGNNQSAAPSTAFADPLVVSVTANNPVEPVAGGSVVFTAPASGASAILSGSPAVIGSDGKASVTATANATNGSYTVSASAAGIASPATFSLSNSDNLIVNGDFESGNTGFTTGYSYSPGNIVPETTYDIVTNPHNSHSGAESYGDHTTGHGLMMALNGATSYPTTVWSETVSVQPNTIYQFSGWVSDWSALRDSALPDLDFNFNSVLAGQFNVPPNEPIGQWDNVTFTLNSGNNSTLTITILDTQTAAVGNDFALDDLSLQATSNVVLQPTLSVTDAGGTYNGSAFPATGKAVGVDGKTPVSGSFSYAYYDGSSASGTPSATAPTNVGTYTVVATFTSSDPNYASGGTAQTTFTITPATPTVTSTADNGSVGTLRWVISQLDANSSNFTSEEIDFDIGTVGSAHTINLTSTLPALTASGVYINGLSQGGNGNTKLLITLNGSGAGASDGLLLQGSNCTVSGLTLENFAENGIEVEGSNDTIGGSVLGSGNVISGNAEDGILLDSTASGTVVQGNSIGINAAGTTEANGSYGISIAGTNNTIGGTVYRARNIIAGNSKDGVLLASSASGNLLLGNLIGVNAVGNAVANSVGVEVAGTSNTIGGVASGSRNIISGNSHDGVLLDSTASGNQVLGNYVGTNLYGTAVLGNGGNGIEVAGNGNTLGSTNAAANNVISGNSNDGVLLDSGASGNEVLGNFIGTDYTGTTAVANKLGIEDAGNNNTLGGGALGARNIISGNKGVGVLLDGPASGETVQGNFMGLNKQGTAALGNGGNGIEIQGVNNTIGGNSRTDYFTRNFVTGNGNDGVLIDSGGSGNQVLGNFIGLDISGTHGVGNVGNGVEIAGTSNTIGGTTVGLGNTISGSSKDGMLLGSTATGNLVQGNDIGTDYTGTKALGNSSDGIEVIGVNNTLGGTTAGAGNVLAANSNNGVQIDSGASGTLVQGNYIGTNAAGGSLGNGSNGVSIASNDNTIGGNAYRAANTIANNNGAGVLVNGGTGDSLLRNSIVGNTGLGISLTNGGNDNVAAPSIPSASYSGGTLTVDVTYDAPLANVSYAIELFASPGSDEGAVYLGTITLTPKSTGTQSFTYKTATTVVNSNPIITATITDSSGDTSEFSSGVSS